MHPLLIRRPSIRTPCIIYSHSVTLVSVFYLFFLHCLPVYRSSNLLLRLYPKPQRQAKNLRQETRDSLGSFVLGQPTIGWFASSWRRCRRPTDLDALSHIVLLINPLNLCTQTSWLLMRAKITCCRDGRRRWHSTSDSVVWPQGMQKLAGLLRWRLTCLIQVISNNTLCQPASGRNYRQRLEFFRNEQGIIGTWARYRNTSQVMGEMLQREDYLQSR